MTNYGAILQPRFVHARGSEANHIWTRPQVMGVSWHRVVTINGQRAPWYAYQR